MEEKYTAKIKGKNPQMGSGKRGKIKHQKKKISLNYATKNK